MGHIWERRSQNPNRPEWTCTKCGADAGHLIYSPLPDVTVTQLGEGDRFTISALGHRNTNRPRLTCDELVLYRVHAE